MIHFLNIIWTSDNAQTVSHCDSISQLSSFRDTTYRHINIAATLTIHFMHFIQGKQMTVIINLLIRTKL
jgi:hypothetical protein